MYTQTLVVMPSDASCTGEIKLRALLNYLQNVAGMAVLHLEGSTSRLMERGYAWVLLQYEVKLDRLPLIDEPFQVRTRHATGDGFHTLRVFDVRSPSGEALVQAKTSWVLLDRAAGRPVRAAQHLPEFFAACDQTIDPAFGTIPKLGPGVEAADGLFPVRFHDLDANGHVNNAVYFEWAYEATPLDLWEYGLREIRASFRTSARFGDVITVRVREQEPEKQKKQTAGTRAFAFALSGQENPGKPMARFYSVWSPLESSASPVPRGWPL